MLFRFNVGRGFFPLKPNPSENSDASNRIGVENQNHLSLLPSGCEMPHQSSWATVWKLLVRMTALNQDLDLWCIEPFSSLFLVSLSNVGVCMLSRVKLCDPKDRSLLGPSVRGIFQVRILEWLAMPSSRGSSQPGDWTHISCISCISRQLSHQGTATPCLCTGWN